MDSPSTNNSEFAVIKVGLHNNKNWKIWCTDNVFYKEFLKSVLSNKYVLSLDWGQNTAITAITYLLHITLALCRAANYDNGYNQKML